MLAHLVVVIFICLIFSRTSVTILYAVKWRILPALSYCLQRLVVVSTFLQKRRDHLSGGGQSITVRSDAGLKNSKLAITSFALDPPHWLLAENAVVWWRGLGQSTGGSYTNVAALFRKRPNLSSATRNMRSSLPNVAGNHWCNCTHNCTRIQCLGCTTGRNFHSSRRLRVLKYRSPSKCFIKDGSTHL